MKNLIALFLVFGMALCLNSKAQAQGDLPPGVVEIDGVLILLGDGIGPPVVLGGALDDQPPWIFPDNPDGPLVTDFFDDMNGTTLQDPPPWDPSVTWDPNIWDALIEEKRLRDIFRTPPYYVVPPIWTPGIPEPAPYIGGTLGVPAGTSGTRIWTTYFDAWDKIDELEVTLTGVRPNTYYAFQVRFLDGFQAQLPGQSPQPNWGEWHSHVTQMDPAAGEEPQKIIVPNLLPAPSQYVPFYENWWGGVKTDGNGDATFTFEPMGLYDVTSVVPTMPDPVIWRQGTYTGHTSVQYLIQIRYVCYPRSTGWAGFPTANGPFFYPTTWQPYLASEPQIFLITVDPGNRPDPPGPPGGGGQG